MSYSAFQKLLKEELHCKRRKPEFSVSVPCRLVSRKATDLNCQRLSYTRGAKCHNFTRLGMQSGKLSEGKKGMAVSRTTEEHPQTSQLALNSALTSCKYKNINVRKKIFDSLEKESNGKLSFKSM